MKTTLDRAIARGMFVTVETDGDVLVGTVAREDDGRVAVRSGLAGRPFRLDPDDVIDVRTVDASNPHVDRS